MVSFKNINSKASENFLWKSPLGYGPSQFYCFLCSHTVTSFNTLVTRMMLKELAMFVAWNV
jgi:hypothetical protein